MILKQSTQIKVRVGPFVDVGDGFTPETGVDLSTADEAELLKANGAATVDISGATWAAVSGADGWYDLTLTASHTDTVGELVVVVQDDSVCLPVFARFQVVEEDAYDFLYGAGATPDTDVTAILADTADMQPKVGTLSDLDGGGASVAGNLGDIFGYIDSLYTLASAIQTLLGTPAADVSADIAAVLSAVQGLNDPTAAEVAAAVWDLDATGHQTAGTFGEALGDPASSGNSVRDLIAALNDISVADILTTQMTESYNADGTAPTLAQALFVIMQRLLDFAISGTAISVKKIDGSTEAYTLALDDASNPTSSARDS